MTDSDQQMNTNAGTSITTILQITMSLIILNFFLFVILLLLYIRAKYFRSLASYGSQRLIFAPHEPSLPRTALDPAILRSLPITVFRSEDFKDCGGFECAVCICELTDGEEVRLLPTCKHGFHVECIDMWFHSNSTCPLCRNPVSVESTGEILIRPLDAVSESGHSSIVEESSASSSASSSSSSLGKEGMLLIDIPRRMANGFSPSSSPLPLRRMSPNSPLPTSRLPMEGIGSPAFSRMRSLRRMLSRGKGSCSSPIACDIEQGGFVASKCQ